MRSGTGLRRKRGKYHKLFPPFLGIIIACFVPTQTNSLRIVYCKLDRHVISGIDHEPEKQENVKKLVQEFHSRKMMVLAEGVEEKEEFEYLVRLGIDLFQGYYLARPA